MKYNKSKIMKEAWNLVKNFGRSMSAALKEAWMVAKNSFKQLEIKDWFFAKKAEELGIYMNNTRIFAVLRETEKAYYVLLNVARGYTRTTWVPKSCVVEASGCLEMFTRFDVSYEEAVREARWAWFE